MQLFQDFVLRALGNDDFLAVFEHYFISLFVSIYRESVLDVFSSQTMSSPTERDATQDPQRESSDDESVVDHELEEVRKNALEANKRFLDLQKRSHGKATPPAPAPTPATAEHQ